MRIRTLIRSYLQHTTEVSSSRIENDGGVNAKKLSLHGSRVLNSLHAPGALQSVVKGPCLEAYFWLQQRHAGNTYKDIRTWRSSRVLLCCYACVLWLLASALEPVLQATAGRSGLRYRDLRKKATEEKHRLYSFEGSLGLIDSRVSASLGMKDSAHS